MPLVTISSFVEGLLQSQLLDADQRAEVLELQDRLSEPRQLAQELLKRGWLTPFQINQIFQGKGRGLILGPFVLLERLGEGGMGQVFKARQKMLNRSVALKVIRKEFLDNSKVIQRFQREIRAAAQLSHPHIVRAYDADQVNGVYYFAMEYIEGTDLARMVRENGPLKVVQACEYIRQAALGLQHAHERGLVHRDIKPANLLVARAVSSDRRRSSGMIPRPLDLTRKSSGVLSRSLPTLAYPWGVVKILDMGLARCTDAFTGRAATHLTQIGAVMGTPEFIAPEQARDSHTSDIRADLYSLGCTLYFLLGGRAPFPNGTLTEKLIQHQMDEPEPVANVRRERLLIWQGEAGSECVTDEMLRVPAPVERIVRRLMQKDPDDRYQTPIELANQLQTIVTQLVNGTLAEDEGNATVEMPVLPPAVEASVKHVAAARTAMPPLVRLAPNRPAATDGVGTLMVVIAAIGGLVSLFAGSVVAALMLR
jgi:eukaryotic-like serine/threonine-protein kinase